jgi:hypothetical protein
MTMAKTETIKIQIGEEVIELLGKDKETFIAQREADKAEFETKENQIELQKELKKSAYTKLGLTEEEINAIL